MFDALFYCYVMINIKHGGHLLVIANVVRMLHAYHRAMAALLARLWRGTPPPARQSPILCSPLEAWMQSLTRLETYVASMA
jgi:hypothetical protein